MQVAKLSAAIDWARQVYEEYLVLAPQVRPAAGDILLTLRQACVDAADHGSATQAKMLVSQNRRPLPRSEPPTLPTWNKLLDEADATLRAADRAHSSAGALPRVLPKNPAVSVLMSFLLPGLGSIANGEIGDGVAIMIAYVVSCVLMLVLIGFILAPAVWIVGTVHAYKGAQRWNGRHGIVS